MMIRIVLMLASLGGFCLASASDDTPYRLPTDIEPFFQTIELTLDPSQPGYTGKTEITLTVAEDVDRIGINQVGLSFVSVVLSSEREQRMMKVTDDDWERVWLFDGEPIQPGEYHLTIEFSGQFSRDALGMHSVRYENNDYIFTQFETMYARRAFPSFDEPSFKIPYQLIINSPQELAAVANSPVASRSVSDGWQRVTFMSTPPMPSYLIAYAVGPLDSVPIEGLSVPGMVHVPKGHAGELGFVLEHTPTIVAALEDYFGFDYPYRKLDFVAVPEFAFGAMENPGLITYRTDLLLVGDEVSGTLATNVLNVIAHEVAHIWYGDLVTMAWWNDLWLNEAFATWMANTILASVYPHYETDLNLPQDRAFVADELTSSSAIRRVVRNNDDVWANIGINYTKGHTLLRMLERFVGPETWQRAIRKYVEKYAWSNATESDLWEVVAEVSGQDISAIAGDYLNQPGFALVAIDKSGQVTQERYVREGRRVEPQFWRIPLTVKYKVDGQVRQTFTLLQGETGSLDVPNETEWVFPDAGGNGYFRWSIDLERFYNLIDDLDALAEREKVALLDNTDALLNAGVISVTDYLFALQRFLQDPHPLVLMPALEKLRVIGDELVTADTREKFATFVEQALLERLAVIGVRGSSKDDEAVVQMRPQLVRIFGQFGTDESFLADASTIVDQYFKAPESVQPDLAVEAMRVVALQDDGQRYKQYRQAYLDTQSVSQKSRILGSMYFDEPEVALQQLEFSLSEAVQAGDALTAIYGFAYVLEDHSILYEWLDENAARLTAKIPEFQAARLPQYLARSCNQRNLDLLKSWFAERGDRFSVSLEKAVEVEESCIARTNLHREGFETFLMSIE